MLLKKLMKMAKKFRLDLGLRKEVRGFVRIDDEYSKKISYLSKCNIYINLNNEEKKWAEF